MPNQDKTGPEGKGAKTGRGLGRCDGDTVPTPGLNRGNRPRRGLGRRRQSEEGSESAN